MTKTYSSVSTFPPPVYLSMFQVSHKFGLQSQSGSANMGSRQHYFLFLDLNLVLDHFKQLSYILNLKFGGLKLLYRNFTLLFDNGEIFIFYILRVVRSYFDHSLIFCPQQSHTCISSHLMIPILFRKRCILGAIEINNRFVNLPQIFIKLKNSLR